ncbi:unnamed protein product [Dicrocoelium dendriticum]|nr:unnamed protein product [Dicrocoelium dendriticum]
MILSAATSLRRLQSTFVIVNEEIICRHLVTLFGGNVDSTNLWESALVGEHSYPFEFHLPASCPSTFTGSRGSVEFSLRACLHLINGKKIQAIQGFVVVREVVIGKEKDILSTLSCPPISRRFINEFNYLKGDSTATQPYSDNCGQLDSDNLCSEENLARYADSTNCSKTITPFATNQAQKTSKLFRSASQSFRSKKPRNVNMTNAERIRKPCGTTELSMGTTGNGNPNGICRKLQQMLADKSSSTTRTPKLGVNKCIRPHYQPHSVWIPQNQLSTFECHPFSGSECPTRDVICCRLTISQRQVIPGDSLVARLALVMNDPLWSWSSRRGRNKSWTTTYHNSLPHQLTGSWSPLARAFISFFVENQLKQSQGDMAGASFGRQRKRNMKPRYRIYLALRQLVTYKDRTNHVIAEEERDVYLGEMKSRQANEEHLFRAVLEDTFQIPPVTASGLEGVSCIDVSYSVGVVYFRLKRLTHLWLPNEWQLAIEQQSYHAMVSHDIERLYSPNQTWFSGNNLKLSQRLVGEMWSIKRHAKNDVWGCYSPLLLPISLTIGTSKVSTNRSFDRETFHLASTFASLYRVNYSCIPSLVLCQS